MKKLVTAIKNEFSYQVPRAKKRILDGVSRTKRKLYNFYRDVDSTLLAIYLWDSKVLPPRIYKRLFGSGNIPYPYSEENFYLTPLKPEELTCPREIPPKPTKEDYEDFLRRRKAGSILTIINIYTGQTREVMVGKIRVLTDAMMVYVYFYTSDPKRPRIKEFNEKVWYTLYEYKKIKRKQAIRCKIVTTLVTMLAPILGGLTLHATYTYFVDYQEFYNTYLYVIMFPLTIIFFVVPLCIMFLISVIAWINDPYARIKWPTYLGYHHDNMVPFYEGYYRIMILQEKGVVHFSKAAKAVQADFIISNMAIDVGQQQIDPASGLTVGLCVLTIFCISLSAWTMLKTVTKSIEESLLLLGSVLFLCFLAFLSDNFLVFLIIIEGSLAPLFIIITGWGSRERKKYAATVFYLYTVIASIPALFAIAYLYDNPGTWNISGTAVNNLSLSDQTIIFWGILMPLIVKIPLYPLHSWLLEAHVEAPTGASMALAAVLLKLGTFGIVQFVLPICSDAVIYYRDLLVLLGIVSLVLSSAAAIRQTDLKRIIAYSSVSHMALGFICVVLGSRIGIISCIFGMISHGLVSAALFHQIGAVYDRFNTRLILHYASLGALMPVSGMYYLILSLANMGFPALSGGVSEFLNLIAIFKEFPGIAVVSVVASPFILIFSLWTYNRIYTESSDRSHPKSARQTHRDSTPSEHLVQAPLLLGVIALGILPSYLILSTF